MRHVQYRPGDIKLPPGWTRKTKIIRTKMLKQNNASKIGEIIDANGTLWRSLSSELEKVFHSKCWYTEAKQVGTDKDVDHYRPKKRVAELSSKANEHPGYWWLAFNRKNYRFSCIYANRRRKDQDAGTTGGKHDHFPVWDESNRAWCPRDNCNNEEPLLLDPCNPEDIGLILFKQDGEAIPRFDEESDPKNYLRAKASIQLYNLNHKDFVHARQQLRNQVDVLLERAEKYYTRYTAGDDGALEPYSEAIADLKLMTLESAEFSAYCMDIIQDKGHADFLQLVEFG